MLRNGGLQTLARHGEAWNLIRVVRPQLERPGKHLIGVPLQVGNAWIILASMDDRIDFDGFDALRLADIERVEKQFPRRTFYVQGLGAKRAKFPMLARLELGSTKAMIESIQQRFALVVVDREVANPGASEIGRVQRISDGRYTMKELDPAGSWLKAQTHYRQKDITRVGF